MELKDLKFGDKIYDCEGPSEINYFYGEAGLVISVTDNYVYIAWEKNGTISYKISEDLNFSFEKPKKMIRREVVRYVNDHCLEELNSDFASLYGRNLQLFENHIYRNKITITWIQEE